MVKVCPPGVLPTFVLKEVGKDECLPPTLRLAWLSEKSWWSALGYLGADWGRLGPSCYYLTPSLISAAFNNSPVNSAEKEVDPFREDPVFWGTFEF